MSRGRGGRGRVRHQDGGRGLTSGGAGQGAAAAGARVGEAAQIVDALASLQRPVPDLQQIGEIRMASKVSHWPKLEVSFNDRPHIAFGCLLHFCGGKGIYIPKVKDYNVKTCKGPPLVSFK